MAIADLSNVLNIFRGVEQSAEVKEALFHEILLMTLARATSSDANIDPCEIQTVQKILKDETGNDFTEADIRLASRPTLYEEAPFRKYLATARKRLDSKDISRVVQALAEVLRSDTKVRELEIDFFNMVADALRATPAETIGMVSD